MDSLLYIATSAYYYSTLIMAPYVLLKYKVIGLKKKIIHLKQKKKLGQNDNGISFSVYVNLKNVIRSNTQESRVVHVVNGLIERHVLYL